MTTRTGDFDVEYQVFSPIPTAPAACGWSAELMHPGSDAEHHFGIGFMGFNKQSSAVDWQQVQYQYTAANDIAGGVIVAHGTRASGITGETTLGVVCLASFTDTWLTELLFAAIPFLRHLSPTNSKLLLLLLLGAGLTFGTCRAQKVLKYLGFFSQFQPGQSYFLQ